MKHPGLSTGGRAQHPRQIYGASKVAMKLSLRGQPLLCRVRSAERRADCAGRTNIPGWFRRLNWEAPGAGLAIRQIRYESKRLVRNQTSRLAEYGTMGRIRALNEPRLQAP